MIGKSLAHYEILERIGAGGMGEVFRARDTKLGREPRSFSAALISSRTGNESRTRVLADSTRVICEKKVKEFPRDYRVRGTLGAAYALLGRNDDAVREGKLGVDMMPMSRDHLRGASALIGLAYIYTLVGEEDAAIDQIEYLLSTPVNWSIHDFRMDPVFGTLKGNPRFDVLEGTT